MLFGGGGGMYGFIVVYGSSILFFVLPMPSWSLRFEGPVGGTSIFNGGHAIGLCVLCYQFHVLLGEEICEPCFFLNLWVVF